MLRALLNRISHRPSVRPARRGLGRGAGSALSRRLFASYVESSGCLPPQRLDRHDTALRRRRIARRLGVAGLTALGAWVVIESARALAMF